MKVRAEQLSSHITKTLLPVYLISGDDPLLVQESCDILRAHTKALDYTGREVMHVETGFDWNGFLQSSNSLSLFAEKRLLELRMPSGKPGDAGRKALLAYCERPADDTVLLIITEKLDQQTQKTKWVKAVDSIGAFVQIWPMDIKQMPDWVSQRMRKAGMQPTRDAAQLIAERVEGNLLAAVQEIEKLALIHGDGPVDVDDVIDAVVDSARFDVFKLADTALAGDSARTARIMDGLREEGIEPVLVLWALTRELRALAAMAHEFQQGADMDRVLSSHRVWQMRKALVKRALMRYKVGQWRYLLRRAGHIDRIIKGMAAGNAWDEMLQLGLMLAGVRLIKPALTA